MKAPRWAVLLSGIIGTTLAGAEPSPLHLAPYAGNRAAAISYTFDDGLRDQWTLAVPMLAEVDFRGTFFVIPGRVSATVEDAEQRQFDRRAWGTITWDEVRTMHQAGHEIGNHTWTHPNLLKIPLDEAQQQIDQAYTAIATEIGEAPRSLAYPFNADSPEIEALARRQHLAVRDRQTGFGGDPATVEQLNAWADQQVADGTWGIAMLHAIARGYAAFLDPEIFRQHLHHVKSREGEIWVAPFSEIAAYVQARDQATLEVIEHDNHHLRFTLHAPTSAVPLTIVFNQPGSTSVRAVRGDTPLTVTTTPEGILIDAAPSPEPVTLTWP